MSIRELPVRVVSYPLTEVPADGSHVGAGSNGATSDSVDRVSESHLWADYRTQRSGAHATFARQSLPAAMSRETRSLRDHGRGLDAGELGLECDRRPRDRDQVGGVDL